MGFNTRCHRLTTAATFELWSLVHYRGNAHRSLVTPERVLSEYNKAFFIFFKITIKQIHGRITV